MTEEDSTEREMSASGILAGAGIIYVAASLTVGSAPLALFGVLLFTSATVYHAVVVEDTSYDR